MLLKVTMICQPMPGEGEECADFDRYLSSLCAPGLLCAFGSICRTPIAEGESCRSEDCEDGLGCEDGTCLPPGPILCE